MLAMKKKLHILFPGGFKPVHAAHIFLAENAVKTMSQDYEPEVHFLVSSKGRGSISTESTIKFLRKIAAQAPYMHVDVPVDCPSPIRYAYILTQAKAFGDGCYCLLSSTKGSDIKRAKDFFTLFDKHGKYHTEGVEPILMETVSIPLEFSNRTDEYQHTPISSNILRMDLINKDFENFFDGYRLLVECGWMDCDDIKRYYDDLRADMGISIEEGIAIQHLNEGGLGGHISHPYEIDDMTFADLSELILKLFHGDITDVTEKIDGVNLFASVGLDGEPIFARNLSHISEIPYKMKDIENPDNWHGGSAVSETFRKGAEIIAKVFSGMDNSAVNFFNITDSQGNLIERKWINAEIVNPENINIIPYSKLMVLFHDIRVAVESPDGIFWKNDDSIQEDLEYLNSIAEKVSNGKAGADGKVVLEKNEKGGEEAIPFLNALNDIRSDFELIETATIFDYKKAALIKFISSKFKNAEWEIIDALGERWLGNKGKSIYNLYWFKQRVDPETYEKIREFEKNDLPVLKKKIVKPLELLFIKIGNKIISKTRNLINAGSENKVEKQIRKQILDIIELTDKEGTESDKDKLEQLLVKMNQVKNTINASEGLVFRYKNKMLKLTGSFSIISAMNNIKYKNKK